MEPDVLISQVAVTGEELARFLESVPQDLLDRVPAPDQWSIAQIGGHAAEFPAHWAMVAAGLARRPGSDVGRRADDLGRMGGVARFTGATPGDVAAAVRLSTDRAVATLRELRPDDWEARGRTRDGAERSARCVVEDFIVKHGRDHLEQARAALASLR